MGDVMTKIVKTILEEAKENLYKEFDMPESLTTLTEAELILLTDYVERQSVGGLQGKENTETELLELYREYKSTVERMLVYSDEHIEQEREKFLDLKVRVDYVESKLRYKI